MGFNLDTYREAHRPWTFTTGGRTWVAQPVSVEQVMSVRAQAQGASVAEQARLTRELLRLAFPRTISMRWRGDPVSVIMAANPPEREAILSDFFASLQPTAPGQSPTPSTAS